VSDPSPGPSGVFDPAKLVDELGGNFSRGLGLELTEISGDLVRARWSTAPHLEGGVGVLHLGVLSSVVETLASMGAAMWLGNRGKVIGVNNSTDFFAPVGGGELSSTATPIHRGPDGQLWSVETLDDDGVVVSRGQVRLQHLSPDS
jgi:uncharacterized protein (TIGR00369 family)